LSISTLPVLRLVLVLCFCLVSPALAWFPDIKSTEGRIRFLQSLDQSHKGSIFDTDFEYRANLLKTLREMEGVEEKLGDQARSLELKNSRQLSIQYTEELGSYDQKAMAEVQSQLRFDGQKLSGLFIGKTLSGDISKDLTELKNMNIKDFKGIAASYVRLWPLLAESGAGTILEKINDLNPSILQSIYLGQPAQTLKAELTAKARERGFGEVEAIATQNTKVFLERQVNAAITRRNAQGKPLHPITLSLEEVPAAVTPFRGCVGGDCSHISIPYYGLVKGSHVYWVKENEKIKGYVIVASVQTDDHKTLPYIISFNGAGITKERVKKAIELIAKTEKSDEVIVPDFSKNHYIVNEDDIREAMIPASSAKVQKVQVKLPAGFQPVSEYQEQLRSGQNYYSPGNISAAVRARVKDLTQPETTVSVSESEAPTRYSEVKSIGMENKTLLQRAIFGAQLLGTRLVTQRDPNSEVKSTPEEIRDVLSVLRITARQLEAAQTLIHFDAYRDSSVGVDPFPLDKERYDLIHGELGLSLDEMLEYFAPEFLPKSYRKRPFTVKRLKRDSLINLKNESPSLMSIAAWKKALTPYYEARIQDLKKGAERGKLQRGPLEALLREFPFDQDFFEQALDLIPIQFKNNSNIFQNDSSPTCSYELMAVACKSDRKGGFAQWKKFIPVGSGGPGGNDLKDFFTKAPPFDESTMGSLSLWVACNMEDKELSEVALARFIQVACNKEKSVERIRPILVSFTIRVSQHPDFFSSAVKEKFRESKCWKALPSEFQSSWEESSLKTLCGQVIKTQDQIPQALHGLQTHSSCGNTNK